MRSFVAVVIVLAACEPPPTQTITAAPDPSAPRAEACRDDIPDCVAACALRETRRTEFIDFYERRCAAVILGKNPEKVVEQLQPTPYATASPSASGEPFPPESRGSFSLQPPPTQPFDPTLVPRTTPDDPAECKAARMLRAQRRDREADMLSALCIAKGGDAGS